MGARRLEGETRSRFLDTPSPRGRGCGRLGMTRFGKASGPTWFESWRQTQQTLAAVTARVGKIEESEALSADDVSRLEPLRSLQQVELYGFALVQRAVTVLLDRGEMNEDILPCGPLDKPVSLSPVEPLDCALLSHKKLLSPLLCLEIPQALRSRCFLHNPPQNLWTKRLRLRAPLNSRTTRKAPEFSAVGREHGAKLWSLSWWREFRLRYTQHQPELTTLLH
jgi:hypothetical protein